MSIVISVSYIIVFVLTIAINCSVDDINYLDFDK